MVAYQHNPLKQRAESPYKSTPLMRGNHSKIEAGFLSIFPSGFSLSKEKLVSCEDKKADHLHSIKRGQIHTFSRESSNRLKSFLISHEVPDHLPYSVTFTTRENNSPEKWRSIMKRFRTYFSREFPYWGACWRVELQKRKAPHLHCVIYSDEKNPAIFRHLITDFWLRIIKEKVNDMYLFQHSANSKLIESTGWHVYMALHNSKSNGSQLGWKGRQWGIWNKAAWKEREPSFTLNLSYKNKILFIRRLRRWSRNNRKIKNIKGMSFDEKLPSPLRYSADKNIPAFCVDETKILQLLTGII
tara:strand:+ start:521 stop:1420 length:900 start_codon:yes stop_codon:yes gene_type:complete